MTFSHAAARPARPPALASPSRRWHDWTVQIRRIRVTRYVTPLREGGSLPAIVEADDDGMYVVKFRGAGQGPKALIAELLTGEIARALGLRVPEVVLCDVDADLARTEPDHEISALIRRSAGLNLALDYLPGSVTFDPMVDKLDPDLASRIVWFDAYVSNVDRTARNPNMLMWHRNLWLIDHGASLYFQHKPGWESEQGRATESFSLIKNHVLLLKASMLQRVDATLAETLTPETIDAIVNLIPEAWLADGGSSELPAVIREAYRRHLVDRLAPPRLFVEEATRAR